MKYWKMTFLAASSVGLLGLAGGSSLGTAFGDSHEREGRWFGRSAQDVTPVDDPSYATECGSCHMAYQPGWLPERSWRKLMNGLDDHFGDNAELDPQTQAHIVAYLATRAAGKDTAYRSQRMAAAIPASETPIRITGTRYFQRKHHELSARMVVNNPEVGSFAMCDRCHGDAARGVFDEDGVRIPGVRNWDD